MDDIKISVIVPVYKVEKYLHRCVESIQKQTHKNLEIILIDDGSPDNCGDMCDELSKIDSRIKVVHKKNGGLASARNAGYDVATGDYISCIDSDDWIEPTMYEDMLRAMLKNDADISRCGYISEYGYKSEVILPNNIEEVVSQEEYLAQTVRGGAFNGVVWNKIFKKSVLGELRHDETIKYAEDIPLIYEISKRVNKCVYVKKAFYHYIKNNSGSINATAYGLNEYPYLAEKIFKEQVVGSTAYYNALDWLQLAVSAYLHNEIQNKNYADVDFSVRRFLLKYLLKIMCAKNISNFHKKRYILLYFSKKMYYKMYKKSYKDRNTQEFVG